MVRAVYKNQAQLRASRQEESSCLVAIWGGGGEYGWELPLGTVVLYYLAVFWKHVVPLLFSTFKVDRNLSIHVPALSGIAEMFIFIVLVS